MATPWINYFKNTLFDLSIFSKNLSFVATKPTSYYLYYIIFLVNFYVNTFYYKSI